MACMLLSWLFSTHQARLLTTTALHTPETTPDTRTGELLTTTNLSRPWMLPAVAGKMYYYYVPMHSGQLPHMTTIRSQWGPLTTLLLLLLPAQVQPCFSWHNEGWYDCYQDTAGQLGGSSISMHQPGWNTSVPLLPGMRCCNTPLHALDIPPAARRGDAIRWHTAVTRADLMDVSAKTLVARQ